MCALLPSPLIYIGACQWSAKNKCNKAITWFTVRSRDGVTARPHALTDISSYYCMRAKCVSRNLCFSWRNATFQKAGQVRTGGTKPRCLIWRNGTPCYQTLIIHRVLQHTHTHTPYQTTHTHTHTEHAAHTHSEVQYYISLSWRSLRLPLLSPLGYIGASLMKGKEMTPSHNPLQLQHLKWWTTQLLTETRWDWNRLNNVCVVMVLCYNVQGVGIRVWRQSCSG